MTAEELKKLLEADAERLATGYSRGYSRPTVFADGYADSFFSGHTSLHSDILKLVAALEEIGDGISPMGGITPPDGIRRKIATRALTQFYTELKGTE